jgi:hypothetical protein
MNENVPTTPNDGFGLLRSYSRHRDFVRLALLHVTQDIERRSLTHDASKMLDDEFAGFARINAIARVNKFGSEEYKAYMKQERATIDLHFSRNSHHPERPRLLGNAAEDTRGLPDDFTYWQAHDGARMTFLDVIEMVCDWWGARKGYGDSRSWRESVELNFTSKGHLLSPEQLWLARDVAAFLETMEPAQRFTKNCGRDECPAPAPTLTNGHERSCQTQQKGAYPHCTCAPCAQHCAYRDPIVMAADAAKAACIRRLQRAISDIGRRGMLPLNADECVAILERMTWEGEMPIATACPKCGGVGVVAGDDPTCLACLGSGKAEP